MEFWTSLAFNAVLQVLEDKKKVAQFGRVLAKVFVKIEKFASMNASLTEAIRLQRAKEGLGE